MTRPDLFLQEEEQSEEHLPNLIAVLVLRRKIKFYYQL
jgi:hypothetical protein